MLRQYLSEHVVINNPAVERYATSLSRGVSSAEAKAWIYKRVRTQFLNDERYLTLMGVEEVPQGLPDYVTQAMDRGENIYQFSVNSPSKAAIDALTTRIEHIKDFFRDIEERSAQDIPKGENVNAMEVNAIVLAKKWMTKIPRLTIEQAEQAADEWAKVAGAGAKTLTKDGVVVIYQWPNGYYAVRFTDRATMQRDGHDLQNCLRQGTYWENVANGSQWVVAIRKPNDEAVVGMRWQLPEPMKILECKGKNNMPATGQYVPYITELLTYFKVNGEGNHDLKSAGIHISNGVYGTFRDLAKHTNSGGVDYYISDSRIEGQIGDKVVGLTLGAGQIGRVEFGDATDEQVAEVMNNLPRGYALSAEAATTMERRALFQGPDGSWGTFEDISDFTRVGDIGYWVGKSITKAKVGDKEYRIQVANGNLLAIRMWGSESGGGILPDLTPGTIIPILRNMPTPITEVNENLLRPLRSANVFFDADKGFGPASEVGKMISEPTADKDGVYFVAETSEMGRLVFEDPDTQQAAMATVVRKKVDEVSSALIGNNERVLFLVEVLNKAGFLASQDIEDNHILHTGHVATKDGYRPIEEAGQVVGDLTNTNGETTTLMVAPTNPKGWVFLYRDGSSHTEYEAFRLSRGKLNSLVFYNRGADSFERVAGNLILRKYQASEVVGIDTAMVGGFKTRYEKIVADPDQLISMMEALGDDVRLDLGQLLQSTDSHQTVNQALHVGPWQNLSKAQAARLYNALNPMKLPDGPVKVSRRSGEEIYGKSFGRVFIQMASSLAEFEPVWIKHPTILERYKKVLAAMSVKATKAINEAGEAQIMFAESTHYDNRLANATFTALSRLADQKNREVKQSIARAAEETPADADASSRFAALNTKRRLYR